MVRPVSYGGAYEKSSKVYDLYMQTQPDRRSAALSCSHLLSGSLWKDETMGTRKLYSGTIVFEVPYEGNHYLID